MLPASRSVQTGATATAFATIINTLNETATRCGMALLSSSLPADFGYQTTDPATNALTGTPDTPVDIGPGGFQSYVFALTPTAEIVPTNVELAFDCTNTGPASIVTGLNTLLLSASSTPVPDIVALGATAGSIPGTVDIPGSAGTGFFSVATVNVGISSTISVAADTGSVVSLPAALSLCETDPATALCINPAVPTPGPLTTTIGAAETPTFAIFATGTGTVPFDPANNRIFVRFQDAGAVTRGSTSVAVQTLP